MPLPLIIVVAALSLALTAGRVGAGDEVVSGKLSAGPAEVVAEITIAAGWHINAHQPRDPFLIPTSLAITAPPGVTVGIVRYPEPVDRVLPFSAGKPMLLYEGRVRLTAPLDGSGGAAPLRATLRYQACDDARCLPPRTLELTSADRAGAGAAASDVGGWIEHWGYGLTFVWVAVLGMALNLTPCVYPLISVTVAFFGGRTGEERGVVGRALLYVLGICTTFSALGVAAALTGSLFGAALQKPVVLTAIALLMVALALGNFGLYQLRMPAGVMQFAGRAGEGAAGALFMGLTMGIVAAPCIGPIVASLLLFVGARQSPVLGFGLFFALGVGLGVPYLALAVAANRLRRLPRGGAWLGWMERLFGVLLLGIALHFATPLVAPGLVGLGWAVLLVGGGVALGFVWPPRERALRVIARVAGVGAIVIGIGGLGAGPSASPISWQPFSEAALAAARSDGRPVLIDFEATWCLPCREMDRTTLRDPAVVAQAAEFVALKADVTSEDEVSTALMTRFQVPGVPTYVLLDRGGRERQRLTGFVPADRMLEAMREVANVTAAGRG